MFRNIPEPDWKAFKEIHSAALERFCEKILAEAKSEIENSVKSSHDKYLGLYKLFDQRDKDLARAFNDFRRSTALLQIAIIDSMGLLTEDELRRFSPDTVQFVESARRSRNA
jgi:hypothetical protein